MQGAPSSATIGTLTGRWSPDQWVSDSEWEVNGLKGLTDLSRVVLMGAQLSIQQPSPDKITMYDCPGPGSAGNIWRHTLDYQWKEVRTHHHGTLKQRGKWISPDELGAESPLRDRFAGDDDDGGAEAMGPGGKSLILIELEREGRRPWYETQIWGFHEVEGQRRLVKYAAFSGPGGEEMDYRVVYDWVEQ